MSTNQGINTLLVTKPRRYWALFLLALASTCLLISYWLWQSRLQILEQARTDSSNLAWILEARIDATLRRADAELMRLRAKIPPSALNRPVTPAQREYWTRELAKHKFQFSEISDFNLFDASGQALYASDPKLPPVNIADRSHFQYLRDNPDADLIFADVVATKSYGRLTMPIVRALRGSDGRFLGTVTALLDFSHFQTLFDSIHLGPNALIVLRKTEGHRLVLRRPMLTDEYNKPVSGPLTTHIAAGEKVGSLRFRSPLDKSMRTATFRVLPHYPFYVFLAIADEDVLAPWWHQFAYSAVIAALFLSILGFLLRQVWRSEMQRNATLHALQQQESSLRQAKSAAEAANVAKSTFLASMSHELRTPLNAVLGYAQLLGMDDEASSDVRESASEIEKAGLHLLALVNDILDLARIESGKLDLSIENVEFDEVLDECLQFVKSRAQARDVTLDFMPTSAILHVDRVRLRQILLNLLSNAVKYNREGGQILVRGAPQKQGRYRIAVTDTGVGLTAQQLNSLFKSFNRLGAETSHVEGTGIGLVITKSLVELMGGSIGVESTPGTGSTFWVDLPQASPVS